ncbi:hypothetical protein J437_LFUL009617 [Ladona fulva]|uniref:Uncharacterized protein n=1 Tax=Ladona fulva TaxID=123851 RepID=A0A8K0KBB5_LADFU|nr:hypothetical protein J437_LFUL009617 [Ladona fulva]
MHGPCGKLNPKSICMEKNVCRKSYPKEFIESTQLNQKGIGDVLTWSWVVPYNPHLLLKYNAHINVGACTSLRAVKAMTVPTHLLNQVQTEMKLQILLMVDMLLRSRRCGGF